MLQGIESKLEKQLKVKDPADRAVALQSLGEIGTPRAIGIVTKTLQHRELLMRQMAADTLEQVGWRAKNSKDLSLFYAAREQWEDIADLGPSVTPTLIWAMKDRYEEIAKGAVWALDEVGWQPQAAAPKDQAFYYSAKKDWSKIAPLGSAAIPALTRTINEGDFYDLRAAIEILGDLDSPRVYRLLNSLRKNANPVIRNSAESALLRFQDPSYLYQLMTRQPYRENHVVSGILAVYPEWKETKPSKEDFTNIAKALLSLPPVGGKVPIIVGEDSFLFPERLEPSITVEEQVKHLAQLRQKGQLGKAYVHQLTVQRRLPDRFKYAAVALILNSPYQNHWEEPFFSAPWGQVAPLIHDGGFVKSDINPLWQHAEGRTDFLQRVAEIHQPQLETMELLTPEEKSKYPLDELVKARIEQEERGRLLLEAKAYQRLALALHALGQTTPRAIPDEMRQQLSEHWLSFEQKMNTILGEYDLQGAVHVIWFNTEPKMLEGWPGTRYEAAYKPIQRQLTQLEQTRLHHPELTSIITNLLRETVNSIDQTIGLLPKTPGRS